ncbi:MAG: pyridoxamine 5'-phosphate oxidase family protein [Veillonella sp.]|uniref:pyridoxamine 5'-phosphate oxidase family protein n=1 Tax=uncultured Veillonella sp. TaxID=159268 RepID=UPI002610FA75|nr:pyridoxamine 5'-phosphate oxidase family protein [uncultured Veillonella sp.]MDU2208179.1 pyridoxamine 5'-phosphate oxidase family protein [Veillonella sp.]
MFKPIRKKINEIDHSAAETLLQSNRRGILAMNGDNGYPYAIPINYFYDSLAQKIYFHGAKAGHKVESLKVSDKVCFTVYGNERIDEAESWAPYVQSVVVFGRCRLLEAGSESIEQLKEFAMKYYPDEALADDQIARNGRATQMFEITIEHMSGKQVQEK